MARTIKSVTIMPGIEAALKLDYDKLTFEIEAGALVLGPYVDAEAAINAMQQELQMRAGIEWQDVIRVTTPRVARDEMKITVTRLHIGYVGDPLSLVLRHWNEIRVERWNPHVDIKYWGADKRLRLPAQGKGTWYRHYYAVYTDELYQGLQDLQEELRALEHRVPQLMGL